MCIQSRVLVCSFINLPPGRSTACPNVKHGDEWGEPGNCDNGDACQYCHTRTEQQFHPEIYKSTKCNDIQQNGYCPRGAFCAFAHLDRESWPSTSILFTSVFHVTFHLADRKGGAEYLAKRKYRTE